MIAAEMNDSVDVAIPSTAKEIIVTNILSPYFIQAQDAIKDFHQTKDLNHLLTNNAKIFFRKKERSAYSPNLNHHVIVSQNYAPELPSWYCRGTVVNVHSATVDVLLADFGTVCNVSNKSIARYPQSAIPIEPLSFTLCIYNILPLDSEKNVCKEWPSDTVKFAKDLIQNSKKVYFEILAHHEKTNRVFGDLFLVIDDRNLSLKKYLIDCHMGIDFDDELRQAVQKDGPHKKTTITKAHEKSNNNISHNHSTSFDSDNNTSKSPKRIGSFKKKEVLDKILICSNVSCQPLEHLSNSRFATTIHKALKDNGVSKPKQIQSYMWPAIKQGLNVTTIAPTASGKSLGYVVPIINAIVENEKMVKKQTSDTTTKPFALVLCATLKACIEVTAKFNAVVQQNKNIKPCAFYCGIPDRALKTNICNKFQVMVSTPSFLLRMLSKSFASDLNLSELSYLVLDDADVVLHKNLKEVITLIKNYKIINKDFEVGIQNGAPQTIIVSKTWTSEIESFISNFVENSYTCIGSFTEAAAFKGVQGRMLIRHSDKKKYEVLEAIKDYKIQKTMIFCLDSAEACELNEFLMANDVKTLLVHNDMKIDLIQELKKGLKNYLPGMFPAIICTDEILSEFLVSDAEYLIHYSVTNTSKTQFNRRFSVLMDNWTMELDKKCKILILFDETKDSAHFKGVVDILKRFRVELPEDWNVIADGLEIQDNLKKKNHPLCNNIKSLGYCNTDQSCPDRHRVIAEIDVPQMPEISIGDELKLYVTYIHNVTHYAARVVECVKKDKKVVTFPNDLALLSIKLNDCYSKSVNRRSPKVIVPGLICVARISDSYKRVKVLQICETHIQTDKPRLVKIQSIDDGMIKDRFKVHELYDIADQFLNYKVPIVNVHITGVSPFDEENEWGHLANSTAKNWFNNDHDPYVWAKVVLHIGDSIWTDTLVFRSKISGYGDLTSSSLKKIMIEEGHGVENTRHLSHLTHLCVSGGIKEINGHVLELPNKEQESKEEQEQ